MEKKEAIVTALLAGKTSQTIQNELRVCRKAIYNVQRYLKERGTLARKPGSGRRPTATTSRLVNLVRSRVARNPISSMRRIARDVGVSDWSIRKIVKDRLKARSLARTKRFLLTDSLKSSRLDRCKKILQALKKKMPVILFSDEKYFTLDPIINSRTSRFISRTKAKDAPEHIRMIKTTKHPSQIMMFGLVSSTGQKMPPVFLPIGLRMGSKEYLEQVLQPHVLPWIQATFKNTSNVILMQDGAPCHTSKIVQNWLKNNLNFWAKDIWPPSSPDLNPLDFSIWANLRARVNEHQHPNIDTLKSTIIKAWNEFSRDEIVKTC